MKGRVIFEVCFLLVVILVFPACHGHTPGTVNQDPSNKPPLDIDPPQVIDPTPGDKLVLPPIPRPADTLDNTLRPYDGFRRNNNNIQPEIYMPRNYIEKYGCVVLGGKVDKFIYLTFDAGYEAGYTGKILDALKAEGVQAAFFLTGGYIKKNPDLVRRMYAEGHVLANHSMTHPHLSQVDNKTMEWELAEVERLYQELGFEGSPFFRPPYGSYSERSLAWTRYWGYINVFWSLAYKDWDEKNQPGADYAYNHVLTNIHPGAVILLHTNSSSNAQALPRILRGTKAKGYQFRTLYDFLPRGMAP